MDLRWLALAGLVAGCSFGSGATGGDGESGSTTQGGAPVPMNSSAGQPTGGGGTRGASAEGSGGETGEGSGRTGGGQSTTMGEGLEGGTSASSTGTGVGTGLSTVGGSSSETGPAAEPYTDCRDGCPDEFPACNPVGQCTSFCETADTCPTLDGAQETTCGSESMTCYVTCFDELECPDGMICVAFLDETFFACVAQ